MNTETNREEPVFRVVERFSSIQGESTHAGRPCYFIRFAGCNLACSFCDTAYACAPDSGEELGLSELLDGALACGIRLVELTGGEPLLQPDLPRLAELLLQHGFTVLVETNGSLPVDVLPWEVRKILDCKPPSSGMSERNCFANYRLLAPHDEIKFLISDRADFEYACEVIGRERPERFVKQLVFSPVWGAIDFATLAAWLVEANLPEARMQLQMHKFIWPPEQRGV